MLMSPRILCVSFSHEYRFWIDFAPLPPCKLWFVTMAATVRSMLPHEVASSHLQKMTPRWTITFWFSVFNDCLFNYTQPQLWWLIVPIYVFFLGLFFSSSRDKVHWWRLKPWLLLLYHCIIRRRWRWLVMVACFFCFWFPSNETVFIARTPRSKSPKSTLACLPKRENYSDTFSHQAHLASTSLQVST